MPNCDPQDNLFSYPSLTLQGFLQQFCEKAPGQNWGKMIYLTSKLGEINCIEHYKGSKICHQNQGILDIVLCQAYHCSTSV